VLLFLFPVVGKGRLGSHGRAVVTPKKLPHQRIIFFLFFLVVGDKSEAYVYGVSRGERKNGKHYLGTLRMKYLNIILTSGHELCIAAFVGIQSKMIK
jgi:hypothetical protein